MEVQNNVPTDKILTPELVTPGHIQPLSVILLSLMPALIFHPQTPLSLFFTCHNVIGRLKTASGVPFSARRFLNRGHIVVACPPKGQLDCESGDFSIPEIQ